MTDPVAALNSALEGRYRIEGELGEGGMATVYLADDLRHDRKVALKVLRPDLAAVVGADRFLAEIKTTAALQHPHILPLFDSGEAGGFLFYVMPYVRGESLRDRLDREQQLPVDEAVRIAGDVAEALDHAHRQGVVHRDIKPANILLSDGRPLVADFGIALAVSSAGGGRLTDTGLSIGTPYYMSPEQASADRDPIPASDIYSLGCVLYEMLVGDPPHAGKSAQAVLAQILTEEPARVTERRRTVPAHVDAVIARSLERLPADRFADAGEFQRALVDPGFRHGSPTAGPEGAVASSSRLPWAIALVASLVALLLAWPNSVSGPSPRFALPLPDSAVLPLQSLLPLGTPQTSFDVAPDGTSLVHQGYDGSEVALYLRSLDSYESVRIQGTEGAGYPFFSPDGEWIAFFADNELRKVSLRGGTPQPVAPAPNPAGGFWTGDDHIVFSRSEGQELVRVPASGGSPELLTAFQNAFPRGPTPVEGGEAMLATAYYPPHVVVLLPGEDRPRRITQGVSPTLLPSGYLLFVRSGTLYAAPFDPEAFELLAEPVPVLDGVQQNSDMAQVQVAMDGTLWYVPGRSDHESVLAWADTLGRVDTLNIGTAAFQPMEVSPDGNRIAVLIGAAEPELRMYDLLQERSDAIARGIGLTQPVWAPDGSAIAYSRAVEGEIDPTELVIRRLPGQEIEVAARGEAIWVSDWSADGRYLAFEDWTPEDGGEIRIVDLESGEVEPFASSPSTEWGPAFSPDGEWIAFTSEQSGQYEIYVAPYPGGGTSDAIKVSAHDGSEEPRWSPSGQEVMYRSGSRWWAVPVDLGDGRAVPGRARLLVEGPYLNVPGISWDIHPEGDRLLLIDGPREETVDRIHMIPNWVEEMERELRR